MTTYTRGILMILGSAFCLSTSGIGLRVIESANGWQILFYRSLSMMALVFVVLLMRPEPIARRIKNLTLDDFLLALVLGTGFCAYVFALLQTTVANALFIFSAAPFFAAVLGWVVLREAVPVRTWLAIGAAMVGLTVMVGAGVMGGRVLGNLIALWLPMSYAISVVLVRRSKQPDMLLALLLATLVATVISFFCNGIDFSAAEMSFSLARASSLKYSRCACAGCLGCGGDGYFSGGSGIHPDDARRAARASSAGSAYWHWLSLCLVQPGHGWWHLKSPPGQPLSAAP